MNPKEMQKRFSLSTMKLSDIHIKVFDVLNVYLYITELNDSKIPRNIPYNLDKVQANT